MGTKVANCATSKGTKLHSSGTLPSPPMARWAPNRPVLEPRLHPLRSAGYQTARFRNFALTSMARWAPKHPVLEFYPASTICRVPNRLISQPRFRPIKPPSAKASALGAHLHLASTPGTSLPLAAGTKASNSPKLGLLRSKPLGANPQRPLESPGQHDGHLVHFAPHIKLHARYANHPIA